VHVVEVQGTFGFHDGIDRGKRRAVQHGRSKGEHSPLTKTPAIHRMPDECMIVYWSYGHPFEHIHDKNVTRSPCLDMRNIVYEDILKIFYVKCKFWTRIRDCSIPCSDMLRFLGHSYARIAGSAGTEWFEMIFRMIVS
jgi:hypothetical protein